MIKKATVEDRERLLALANEAPSENLFIIGDIETYGFDKDYQEIWYEEIDGKMEGIYLKYRDNAVIYSSSNKMNPKDVVDLLESNKIKHVNALGRVGDVLWPYMEQNYKLEKTYYCVLKDKTIARRYDNVEIPTIDDAEKINDAIFAITEFADSMPDTKEKGIEKFRNSFKEGRKQVCIKENGEIASYAAISVESTTAGMIVSVFTSKKYRGKGYAKACVSTITKMLIDEGKSACLFFDNPSAGRIYQSLGFEIIDTWNMYCRK